MTKTEFIDVLDSMIDSEINIVNLQSEQFNEDVLKTLWSIRAMALELEE